MRVIRCKFVGFILVLILFCTMFTGCGKEVANVWLVDTIAPTSATKGNNGDMYLNTSNYDLYQMQNNKWIKIGNIAGKDGVTPTIEISEDGYWVINGKKTTTRAEGRDGKDGKDGKDGISPLISISEDGYWVINGKKTAVLAKAQDGKDGQDGTNGKDGKDGLVPTVEFSEDGYWIINGVKTKIKAKGEDGKTPTIAISEDGYWVINGVKTKIKAECKNCIQKTNEEIYLSAVESAMAENNISLSDCNECVLISKEKVKCDNKEFTIDMDVKMPDVGSVINFKNGKIDKAILYYDNKMAIKNSDSNFYIGNLENTSTTHVSLLESQIKEVYGKDIKIGDYVEYDETKDETITVGKDVKWRVLGIENGNLLLVSDQNIATSNNDNTVTINGSSYNSEEQLLNLVNEPIKAYGKGNYVVENSARSITAEDINKITGYNPNRLYENNINEPFHKGGITQYGNEVTYTYGTNSNGNRVINYTSSVYKNNVGDLNGSFEYLTPKEFILYDGTKLGYEDNGKTKKSITLKNNYYWYSPEILTNLELEDPDEVDDYNRLDKIGVKKGTQIYDMLFSNTEAYAKSYWLGETYYFNLGKEIWYGLRSVVNEKVGYSLATYYPIEISNSSNKHAKQYSLGVRAVVKLSKDITLLNSDKNTWEIVPRKISDEQKTCILISGEENTKGSKYSCEVKDGLRYRFYVLSHNEDGTTNLILDQNINSDGTLSGLTRVHKSLNSSKYNLLAWNSESGQSATLYGPVTAMNFLYNATKDWTNIDPVNYTYNDKVMQGTSSNANYISFISTNGIAKITSLTGSVVTIGTTDKPLRARMPVYSSDSSKTEVTSKATAPYLYNNLKETGYWTMSSYFNSQVKANYVSYSGDVDNIHVNNINYGVRPVITVRI